MLEIKIPNICQNEQLYVIKILLKEFLGIDFKVHINKREHQKTDSKCGMYCLYFIIQMLKDKDVTYFLKNNIPDEEVFELRNKYFNME